MNKQILYETLIYQLRQELFLEDQNHQNQMRNFEIRTIVGTNLTRVLYFFCIGKKAVLTNGFVKKTQKTPKKEIEKAKSYRDDFLKRSKKMSNKFEDFLNEQLKDPKVKKEYDALEAKYALIESIILARKESYTNRIISIIRHYTS